MIMMCTVKAKAENLRLGTQFVNGMYAIGIVVRF